MSQNMEFLPSPKKPKKNPSLESLLEHPVTSHGVKEKFIKAEDSLVNPWAEKNRLNLKEENPKEYSQEYLAVLGDQVETYTESAWNKPETVTEITVDRPREVVNNDTFFIDNHKLRISFLVFLRNWLDNKKNHHLLDLYFNPKYPNRVWPLYEGIKKDFILFVKLREVLDPKKAMLISENISLFGPSDPKRYMLFRETIQNLIRWLDFHKTLRAEQDAVAPQFIMQSALSKLDDPDWVRFEVLEEVLTKLYPYILASYKSSLKEELSINFNQDEQSILVTFLDQYSLQAAKQTEVSGMTLELTESIAKTFLSHSDRLQYLKGGHRQESSKLTMISVEDDLIWRQKAAKYVEEILEVWTQSSKTSSTKSEIQETAIAQSQRIGELGQLLQSRKKSEQDVYSSIYSGLLESVHVLDMAYKYLGTRSKGEVEQLRNQVKSIQAKVRNEIVKQSSLALQTWLEVKHMFAQVELILEAFAEYLDKGMMSKPKKVSL